MVKTKWRKAKGLRYCVMKSQSAMEYLMTYGWAILIIAVVLGALFQLGVFNSMTFAPKAQPGACQVFRPNDPGTTQFINLEGVCNGELPQYVAQFNGQSSVIAVQNTTSLSLPLGASPRTVIAWFNDKSPSIKSHIFAYGCGGGSCGGYKYFTIYVSGQQAAMNAYYTNQGIPIAINPNQWYFIAYEYNGTYQIGYIGNDGTLTGASGAYAYNTISTPFYIGCEGNDNGATCVTQFWNGSIANVQIYNTYLSQPEIQALYQEGIGGAPIKIQNLVGWWPLNGNANDYSGNNNNGNAISVTYTTGWYSGYSAP